MTKIVFSTPSVSSGKRSGALGATIRFLLGAAISLSLLSMPLAAQGRITYNNQQLFLSGMNVAWVNFAADIGPGPTNLSAFRAMFDSIHANGGNSMRLWLHTTGASTPEFNAAGIVVGPGANTIEDLRAILDLAAQRKVGLLLCLWSFDMLLISRGPTITDRAMRLLSDTAAITAYLDNALVPIVEGVKGHPGIVAWEVFNEAEGMSNEFGWGDVYHVPMSTIQRFVNRVAGAIHRTDPAAQVTTGVWSFIALSDVTVPAVLPQQGAVQAPVGLDEEARIEQEFENRYGFKESASEILSRFDVAANSNYYRDDRLVSSGGDPLGTLDFYTVHYYDWGGTALSPFHHVFSEWQLTKPTVVAEFYLNNTFGVPYGNMFDILYSTGYAGALTWQWANGGTQVARTKVAMLDLVSKYPADIVVSTEKLVQQIPTSFSLHQNYPNPFNPLTTIEYELPRESRVSLRVYNLLGQELAVLVDEVQPAGRRAVTFEASSLSSGVYLYRFEAGGFKATKKLMLIK